MNDLISKKALLKEVDELKKTAWFKQGGSYEIYIRNGGVETVENLCKNAPTVKAITIDRLAEIMAKKFDYPCKCYDTMCEAKMELDCALNCTKRPNKQDCWKEFFEHYAEVEE